MYCSECGARASGKFCSGCGARLGRVGDDRGALAGDWAREARYDWLVAHPEVRALLAQVGRARSINVSGEAILKVYDKFLAKAVGGIEMSDLASVCVPLFTKLGVRTTKERSETIAAPAGRTIVAVLCSFAAHGNTIEGVHQARDGCAIEAVLPSDLWSFEGTIVASVCAQGERSRLEARTFVGGQMFDWGKSMRRLEQLVSDVRSFQARTFAA